MYEIEGLGKWRGKKAPTGKAPTYGDVVRAGRGGFFPPHLRRMRERRKRGLSGLGKTVAEMEQELQQLQTKAKTKALLSTEKAKKQALEKQLKEARRQAGEETLWDIISRGATKAYKGAVKAVKKVKIPTKKKETAGAPTPDTELAPEPEPTESSFKTYLPYILSAVGLGLIFLPKLLSKKK